MEQNQKTKILYMVNRSELVAIVEELINAGNEISVITPLREFTYPNMDGVAITDWLIVYKKRRGR